MYVEYIVSKEKACLFILGVVDVIMFIEIPWKQLLVGFELKGVRKITIPRNIMMGLVARDMIGGDSESGNLLLSWLILEGKK